MVGRILRRVRSILSGRRAQAAPAGTTASRRQGSGVGGTRHDRDADPPDDLEAQDRPGQACARYVLPAPPPDPEPRPVEQLAESLTLRLVEDESLRGNLTDDEYQPLLDWATRRIQELAGSYAGLPAAAAAARFTQTAGQLLELLRMIDLAVGDRSGVSTDAILSRFEMLDTLLAPPLLPGPTATVAQARLEALLAEPPERLAAEDGAALVRRLVEVLE